MPGGKQKEAGRAPAPAPARLVGRLRAARRRSRKKNATPSVEPPAPQVVQASKTWRGRPLYTKEDTAKMDCPYPDEPKWV